MQEWVQQLLRHHQNSLLLSQRLLQGQPENDKTKTSDLKCLFLKYVILNKVSFFFQLPLTAEEWLKCSENFYKQWNFPHCVGALDGKHLVMQAPANSGSYYYNYKGTFSIVLLAVVDAEYKFLYVDVGCNGRVSDEGFSVDATYTTHWKLALLSFPLQYLYLGGHSQFHISLLQMMHLL